MLDTSFYNINITIYVFINKKIFFKLNFRNILLNHF